MSDQPRQPLEQVSPYITQRRRNTPKLDDTLTVDLPGERVRAQVKGVVNDDACVCVILTSPVGTPRHGYQKDDTIPVRRGEDTLGVESWVVISDRELQQREAVAKFEAQERADAAEKEEARIAELRASGLAEQEEAARAADMAKTPWYKRPKA